MKVNRINIVGHDEYALKYKDAGTKLYQFLEKHTTGGADKLKVIGKGVRGDIEHICHYLVARKTWDKFCSYRTIDITPLAESLMIVGRLPQSDGSLEDLAKHFNIEYDAHEAEEDAKTTFEVFKKLLNLIKS